MSVTLYYLYNDTRNRFNLLLLFLVLNYNRSVVLNDDMYQLVIQIFDIPNFAKFIRCFKFCKIYVLAK